MPAYSRFVRNQTMDAPVNTPQPDTWYAIGGSVSLDRGAVQPVHLFGIERVAWRDQNGESHVWHNQCIHRGMRLNYGFVDGNRLACRYHGWRFGTDGKCAHIPAHPDMTPPDDFCIPSSPSAEAGGLIWTSLGKPNDPPPDLSAYANLTFCRTVTIHCPAADVETALDGVEIAPGLMEMEASTGETLVLAIQPVNDAKTNLHVLADAETGGDAAQLRRHFSAWARRFRWQLENPAPADRTA